jgi:PKD repeat protein/subtilisin-like proprotein convertase family protein
MRTPTTPGTAGRWCGLLALAIAASCTDNPIAPESPGRRPRLDVSTLAGADPVAFCNPASITLNQAGASTPYPSLITASGLSSRAFKVTATLNGISHTALGDLDVLLVGPGGQNVMLMSDAAGSSEFRTATVTFDDQATAQLPASGNTIVPGGTYKPTNIVSGSADFFQGVPGPFGDSFAVFAGTDPNGTWRLHIWDDITFEAGSIASGWCVNFTPLSSVPVASAGGPYTVIEGSPLAFDASATTDEGNDIVSYAWSFGDGTTGIGATPTHTYAVMGTYTATLRVTDAEGAVDDATTTVNVLNQPGTSESYCNTSSIVIVDANRANPYPSTLTVSTGISGPFKVTVTLKGFTSLLLTDVDALLVGPGGQKVMLMSDVAGGDDFRNATVTYDDDASAQFPTGSTTGVLPSGAYRPLNVGTPDAMPSPAPSEPYASSLIAFASTSPNGTWSLFLRDDTVLGGGNGSVTGGWCVDIHATNAAPVARAGGPYTAAEGSPITFDGTGSTDPDNNIVTYAWNFGDGGTGSGAIVQHTYASGGTYTVSLTVTDADGASSSATATATITDVAPTAAFNAPASVIEGNAATISLTSPSATDARYAFDCGAGYGAIGSASSAACPTADDGTLAVRAKVVDASIDDLVTEYTASIAVTNRAPTAVFANNGPVSEGSTIQLSLTNASDVAADLAAGLTFAFDCGSGYGAIASCPTSDNGDVAVKGKVTDKDGGQSEYTATVSVTNVSPVVTSISLPSGPVAVNTPVSLGATFTDPGTADTHTGSFELEQGLVVPASVGSGALSATATFTQAGVYTIISRVTDDDGGTGSLSSAGSVTAFVVVYDPNGSFVTGGGWINSPAGAYAAEPTLSGKASFGFVAKYKPGANTPSGNTEFQFKAGDLNFKSTSYDWLVVSAAHAKYKGVGSINGSGSYGFMITAVDGDDEDAFRIRIWELSSGAVVYDNKIGESDDSPSGTALGGGSIVIHR